MTRKFEGLPDEIKNAYQVKLVHKMSPDQVKFGVLQFYDESADELWERDRVLVLEDAVTGALYEFKYDNWDITLMQMTFDKQDPDTLMSIDTEYDRHLNDAYKAAIKRHNKAGNGVQKGKLCTLPVADGMAFYEIIKVNKKTCRVEWRGFSAGRYCDRRWGYGSTVPIEDANMYLSRCAWR